MEKIQSQLMSKTLDLVSAIQRLEEQMDDMYKINLYLMRRYKDDLIANFKIEQPDVAQSCQLWAELFDSNEISLKDSLIILDITNKIRNEMQEEMPDPWYSYGIAQLVNKE